MDRKSLAELIDRSVIPGEQVEDFQWMVDALISMGGGPRFVRGRTARHFRSTAAGDSASVVGRAWFLCLLVKPKPPEYMAAMHQFRLALAGVSKDERLRAVFRAAIRSRLLGASPRQSHLVLRPSHYFDLEKAREVANQLGVDLDQPSHWY